MVPRPSVAEVDDAALVRALVRRLHAGQTQLVGDVAASHFHHLEETEGQSEGTVDYFLPTALPHSCSYSIHI